jgi:UDP-GlcNAc:undecaprenyl-phosphate GlcNAc-1-phosphate transferase
MPFAAAFLLAFAVAAFATPFVRRTAIAVGAVDRPDGGRKLHVRAVPLMGGLAVFAAVAASIAAAAWAGWLPGAHIVGKHVAGILAAATVLALGGVLDDRFGLPPSRQIVWPIAAAVIVIASGIGISSITNPFGGQWHLDRIAATVAVVDGIPYRLTLFADLFTLAWLLGMTYTTKFLDGLDGLVSGIAVIGGLVVAAVSVMQDVSQPDTAVLGLIVAGAFLGFLLFNFHPATIFLGEGGSTLAGFLLGALAIIAGGKIATTLLILGLPIVDAAAVVLWRLLKGRPATAGDRSHLHYRLLDAGFTHRQVVIFYWFVAAAFGTSTLILRGWEKVAALALVVIILPIAVAASVAVARRRAGIRP